MGPEQEPMRFNIGGMHCAACSARVERTLEKMPGIEKASVNLATGEAQVWPKTPDSETIGRDIMAQVAKIGFTAVPLAREDSAIRFERSKREAEREKKERLHRLIPMIAFSVPLLIVSMGHMAGLPLPAWLEPHQEPKIYILVQLLLTLPVVWLGRHFYTEGLAALWRRAPNMDTLVAVGTGAAFIYSLVNTVLGLAGNDPVGRSMNLYYESCAVLLAMIELGKYLEFAAKRKASDAMGALMTLAPQTALLLDDNSNPQEVPIEAVKTGDRLLARPGARIPVDGKVLDGISAIDMSLMTGESIPVPVEPGSSLVAGSLNGEGSLVMEATAVGEDTRLARIINLVRDAQGSKAPIARLADKVSYYFVPAVMLFALLAALAWLIFSDEPISLALTVFVAVLVMACPCAMGLATPMSIMVGTGRGAQLGILIKNGAALEQAGEINALCLDKTGTLTTGVPELTAIIPLDSSPLQDKKRLLTLASSLEGRSEHPLGLAIIKKAAAENCAPCPVENVQIRPGMGISGDITLDGQVWKTVIGNEPFISTHNLVLEKSCKERLDALAEEGQTPLLMALGLNGEKPAVAAILALADQLRPESADVVKLLMDMGVQPYMLTGDNERTARAIAEKAGIKNVKAGLLPAQKADFIRRLQEDGKIVGMVGDGLNDAPALAIANVGLAVGSGVDVSAEAGDIVLMRGGMRAVLSALGLSRAAMRNIRQNLGWAFGYNIIGLPVAAGALYLFGGPLLSPMLAGTAMALSSVSVVTNALRLRLYDK